MKEPGWVIEARKNDLGLTDCYTDTSFLRVSDVSSVLEKKVLPRRDSKLNILMVGPGLSTGRVLCSYEPYLVASIIQGQGIDYQMIIVDKNQAVCRDIKGRKQIYVPADHFDPKAEFGSNFREYDEQWNKYLYNTNQSSREVHELEEGMLLAREFLKNPALLKLVLRDGFKAAEVPSTFREKLRSKDVVVLNDDIATVDLSNYQFDFVICREVLYHLNQDGQKLAMHNMARAMKQGAYMLMSDGGAPEWEHVMPGHDGWFDEAKQRDLGLVVDSVLDESALHTTLVLKKSEIDYHTVRVERQGRIPEGMTSKDRPYKYKMEPIKLDLGVHPSDCGRILIHHPGCFETAEGYAQKYVTLADLIKNKGIAAVLRMDNDERKYHDYAETIYDDLRAVIEHAIRNSRRICGSDNPMIYLMGFSGGTSSIGAVAHEYPQVKKILLMGPGFAIDDETPVRKGLSRFCGEVYIVQGELDNVNEGKTFYDMATAASRKELVIVPNCDHYFRHEVNDRIYSKAPLWAFAGDKTFPSPEGGIRLVRKNGAEV